MLAAETNCGISKRRYPNVDIKNLKRDQAKEIYRRDFWVPAAQKQAPAVAFQVFDAAVHHGISTAIRMLQRAVGAADDGHWGPFSESLYAKEGSADAQLLFLAERLDFMRKLPTFQTSGAGWSGRIVENLRYAAQDN